MRITREQTPGQKETAIRMALNIKSAVTGIGVDEIQRTIGMIITTNASKNTSRIEDAEQRTWTTLNQEQMEEGREPTKEQMEKDVTKWARTKFTIMPQEKWKITKEVERRKLARMWMEVSDKRMPTTEQGWINKINTAAGAEVG